MTIRLKGKFSLICVMNRSDDRLSLLPQFNLRDIYLFFTVGCGSFVMETVLSILLHFTSTKRLLYQLPKHGIRQTTCINIPQCIIIHTQRLNFIILYSIKKKTNAQNIRGEIEKNEVEAMCVCIMMHCGIYVSVSIFRILFARAKCMRQLFQRKCQFYS